MSEQTYWYYKVKIEPTAKWVYLEQPKFVRGTALGDFIVGYEIDSKGESKIVDGGVVQHMIQIGPETQIVPLVTDKKYGNLRKAKKGE